MLHHLQLLPCRRCRLDLPSASPPDSTFPDFLLPPNFFSRSSSSSIALDEICLLAACLALHGAEHTYLRQCRHGLRFSLAEREGIRLAAARSGLHCAANEDATPPPASLPLPLPPGRMDAVDDRRCRRESRARDADAHLAFVVKSEYHPSVPSSKRMWCLPVDAFHSSTVPSYHTCSPLPLWRSR